MTPDEFRTHGKALIDWIADYYEQIEHAMRETIMALSLIHI